MTVSNKLTHRRFTGYGGVTLVADVGGDAAGSTVILLHGGGQTRHSWRRAALELAAAGHYVVVPDLRGHGDSDWAPDQNYSMDAQVGDLLALSRQVPNRPVLVGASMGGLISMTTAGEHLDVARALVLVDVTPHVDASGRARVIGFMQANPAGFATLEEAADVIAAYLPHRPRPRDLSGLHRNLRRRQDGRYYWHWDPAFFGTFETNVAAAQLRYVSAVRNLQIPTLLVRGVQSELVTPENVRHFLELCPHAEYIDVAGARHMVAGDRNDAFNAALLGFLRRGPGNWRTANERPTSPPDE
jgi:non-heme chloroperoxidase